MKLGFDSKQCLKMEFSDFKFYVIATSRLDWTLMTPSIVLTIAEIIDAI